MKLSSFTKYLHLRVINTGVAVRVVVMAFILQLSVCAMNAQDAGSRPSRNVAQAAWIRGDYETAYSQYSGLLLLYSRDPLYQYYTGACLVKLERDIQRAVQLLSYALNSPVYVKSVPDDVWFFYGRALQMSGSFGQAIEAFDRFMKQAGRKVFAEYEAQKYIDQCSAGTGAIQQGEPALAEDIDKVTYEMEREEPILKESQRTEPVRTVSDRSEASGREASGNVRGRAEPEQTEKVTSMEPGQQPVFRGDVTGVPDEQFRILGEALALRHEADSLALQADRASRAAGNTTGTDKEQMEGRAADETSKAVSKTREADSVLLSATQAGSKLAEVRNSETSPAVIVSIFDLRSGPVYSETNPVPIDQLLPSGLVYTVQIAAFRNDIFPSLFKGLYPVYGRKRPGSDAVYYYTGLFRRLDDARKALPEARGAGFPDAFIVAFGDGVQVSMERAALLEAEWSSRPLTGRGITSGSAPSHPGQPAPVGTLSFRAEVMRTDKPVKPDMIQKIEQLAGTRGLEMIKNNSGETVFLIGNFITFESADEYVSLLIRNGYSSARVASYVGKYEIPVEAARELLNKLPDD